MANALQHESSPYLLQHADNPVDWLPWNEETLQKAKDEDKPMLISIGYSACHWCHVMERESFEDTSIAKLMNEHFICIKVDREERPDVDQVYMDAVQLMTGQGGWPLNCFTLPDGRPFFGGTYFDNARWRQTLININDAYKGRRKEVEEYASKLMDGLQEMDDLPVGKVAETFTDEAVEAAVNRWKKQFDPQHGGFGAAPKFPMPNNLSFLLHYGVAEGDQEILDHVRLTLEKMAMGGIYDQIGGGFCRYSVDQKWKVPHFEKMLYDNGQLLSLYAEAYRYSGLSIYRDTLVQSSDFLIRELWTEEGHFYAALDADSEGEEGKYYVWTKEEFDAIAEEDQKLLSDVFEIDQEALWEEGNNIPLRTASFSALAEKQQLELSELENKVETFRTSALKVRDQRARPGLDDKCLTSWNAMAAKGLLDVYTVTRNEKYLNVALQNLAFIRTKLKTEEHELRHTYKDGTSKISGYLEDYAHYSNALVRAYELTFDEAYIQEARETGEYVLEHFDQNANGMFFFKSKEDAPLIAQKAEVNDNVIPASNSVFSSVLFKLGQIFGPSRFHEPIKHQLSALESFFSRYPAGYSQWMQLMMWMAEPFYEICIVGDDCEQKRDELLRKYLPNALICGGKNEGTLPILQGRKKSGETLFYVCQNGACQLPVDKLEQALEQIH